MNEETPNVWSAESLTQTYREHPFIAMGVAAGVGYIMAGGLPTAFTRRLVSNGFRTAVVPFAAKKLQALTAVATSIMDRK